MKAWSVLVLLFMVVTTVHSAIAMTCQDSLTRVVPATTDNAFTVTYKITSTNGGKCGAIIEDTVSGPCSFDNGGKVVLIDDNCDVGTSISVPVSLTASTGTCVFSGNYNFGDCSPNKQLNSDSTSLSGVVVKNVSLASLPDLNKKTEGSAADKEQAPVIPTCKFYQTLSNNACVMNKYYIFGAIALFGILLYNDNYKKILKVK